MKTVDLGDSYSVDGEYAMNIIITRVPVLNAPENVEHDSLGARP